MCNPNFQTTSIQMIKPCILSIHTLYSHIFSRYNWLQMVGQKQYILFGTSVTCFDLLPAFFTLTFVQIISKSKSRPKLQHMSLFLKSMNIQILPLSLIVLCLWTPNIKQLEKKLHGFLDTALETGRRAISLSSDRLILL